MGAVNVIGHSLASSRTWSRGAVVVLGLLVLLASPVAAESRSECKKMSRQIAHFYGVKNEARSRGKVLWEAGTERHILRLEARQERMCPLYLASIEASKLKKAQEEMKAFMRAAALAAARYFAFGF